MEDVNEKAFVLFDKIKEKLRVNKKLCKSWDKCLYYLFTSSKHFTYETYKQLITSTQQIGVKVMSPSAAKKYYAEATRIGRTEGIAKGIAKGEARGIARGRTEGRAKGIAEGIARGEVKGEAKSIIRILRKRLDEPSIELQNKIMNIKSISKLDELLDFAFNCVSLGEFETAFN
jgi:hypothetical protein